MAQGSKNWVVLKGVLLIFLHLPRGGVLGRDYPHLSHFDPEDGQGEDERNPLPDEVCLVSKLDQEFWSLREVGERCARNLQARSLPGRSDKQGGQDDGHDSCADLWPG